MKCQSLELSVLKAAVLTVAGAALGALLDDGRGALIGAALGAAGSGAWLIISVRT